MNIGAFGVVIWLQSRGAGTDIDDFNGLASRAPLPAAALAVFLLSLMGLPPLIGFWAKYYIIVATIQADLVWLAVVVVLTSAISAYFYLKVVAAMYFGEPARQLTTAGTFLLNAALLVTAIATIGFGLFSTPVLQIARGYAIF
jgi:NADH-quinone oxidoreductase subunit N